MNHSMTSTFKQNFPLDPVTAYLVTNLEIMTLPPKQITGSHPSKDSQESVKGKAEVGRKVAWVSILAL